MASKRPPVFDRLIEDLREAWAETPGMDARMTKANGLLEKLLAGACTACTD